MVEPESRQGFRPLLAFALARITTVF